MVTHYPQYKVTIMAATKDVELHSPLELPMREPGKSNDDKDMARLGRSQELIVCSFLFASGHHQSHEILLC